MTSHPPFEDRSRNLRLFVVAVVCFVAIILGILAGKILVSGVDQNCENVNDTKHLVRDLLILSKVQGERNSFPAIISTHDKAERVVVTFPDLGSGNKEYYRRAFALVQPVDCSSL